MTTMFRTLSSAWRLGASLLCSLALLVSCGGGVDSGGTGSPTMLAAGPANGLGSVILNGVRFDVSGATVTDQDDNVLSSDQLLVGMSMRIDALAVQASAGQPAATALAIRTANELIGPIDSVDLAGGSLVVLGQRVRMTAATWFPAALLGGLRVVHVGQVVEVWGQFNPNTGEYVATRIALRPNAAAYQIRGVLTAVDANARTLTIGGLVISDASLPANTLPALTIGRFLRATLATAPSGANVWTALAVSPGNAPLPDRADVRVAGRISAQTSATQFVLNGLSVDASAASFPAGSTGVVLGARVVVTGSSAGGVLSASTVTVKGDETATNSTFEFHGAITALDAGAQTFVVRGITVSYAGTVQYSGGGATDLALGRNVSVVGTLDAGRAGIIAQSIGF